MLLDVRTYRCRPGTINTHLKLYSEKGKPVLIFKRNRSKTYAVLEIQDFIDLIK